IERYKKFLSTAAILRADVKHGREVFERTCAVCHTLFGKGGKIGPELPGNFTDVDYLLQNIIDPNAIIGKDYQQIFITTKDGALDRVAPTRDAKADPPRRRMGIMAVGGRASRSGQFLSTAHPLRFAPSAIDFGIARGATRSTKSPLASCCDSANGLAARKPSP